MSEASSRPTEAAGGGEGRYLYCIINDNSELTFGEIGIEDSRVYTIPYENIAAVVHACPAKIYESNDGERVREWIFSHQYVIDAATKKFGTVLPFSFDVVVKGDDKAVKGWLSKEYSKLKRELEKIKDKSEFTVQIFCDKPFFAPIVEEKNEEVKRLKKEIETKPEGMAYMLKLTLDDKIKDAIMAEASNHSQDFYNRIREYTEDVKVDKLSKRVPEKWAGKLMILNLSCLVHNKNVKKLGEVLGKINEIDGFVVRFTGPWPPFSFVELKGD